MPDPRRIEPHRANNRASLILAVVLAAAVAGVSNRISTNEPGRDLQPPWSTGSLMQIKVAPTAPVRIVRAADALSSRACRPEFQS
jgi:hypothetical protein